MSSHHDPGVQIGPGRVEQVGDGLFAYIQPDGSWWINNTGFLVGSDGVVSVDTCSTERRTRAYLDALGGVSQRPVRTLVNTHHHGDHTHGNCLLPGATIVAHELCREEMLSAPMPPPAGIWTDIAWGEVVPALPFLTFRDSVTIWVDDLACDVRHAGAPAHTTNDSFVWVRPQSVLFAGDLLFNGGTPFVLMGSVTGSIEVLEEIIRPLGARTIVPGHGDVCGPEVIDDVLGYLRFVDATARDARDAGLTPLQAALECDLGAYAGLRDPERIAGNLHRAYAELGGAERGAPIDIVAAIGDMITYNGGRPLRCYA